MVTKVYVFIYNYGCIRGIALIVHSPNVAHIQERTILLKCLKI